MAKQALISSEGKSPTAVVVRESGGVALSQRGQVICLDADELQRLIAVCGLPEPVTPARARMLRYPVTQQTPATPKPAIQQTSEPSDV
jgi:hypothetical protein